MLSQRIEALRGTSHMKATFWGMLTAFAVLAILAMFVIMRSSTGWAQDTSPSSPPTSVPDVCMACHGT